VSLVDRVGLGPTTLCTPSSQLGNVDELLEKFREFQLVDLRRDSKTAYENIFYIRKFLGRLNKRFDLVSIEDIREYLKSLDCVGSATCKT
jgi:hypothetical protein